MKWICPKCKYETRKDPRKGKQKAICPKCNASRGGLQMFDQCPCKNWFHPDHYGVKTCSKICRYKYQKKDGKKGKHYPHLQRAEIRNCKSCGKEFRAINDQNGKKGGTIIRKQIYCSLACYAKKNPPQKFECIKCGKSFIKRKDVSAFNRKHEVYKYCSRKCYTSDPNNWTRIQRNKDITPKEFKSPWYKALHHLIGKKLGKSKKCWGCGFESENSRQFQWANIDHEYTNKEKDWIRLCGRCHRYYDKGEQSVEWLRNVLKNQGNYLLERGRIKNNKLKNI